MPDRKRIVVYHDRCHDGITALFVALQHWPDAEPYAGNYDVPPDMERLRGADVAIIDFSWKRPAMLAVKDVARTLLVLDHHKTAEAELAGLDGCVFDMGRSGAGLAWDWLIGGARPRLIDYVEDRDLWRFCLPRCREVHAACNSYPLTLAARTLLMDRDVDALADEGAGILRYHDKLVASIAEQAGTLALGGYTVPAVACPAIELISDVGHTLARGAPFAAMFIDKPDGARQYSLRSDDNGIDVGAFARSFGGGGHPHAAGFTVPADPEARHAR